MVQKFLRDTFFMLEIYVVNYKSGYFYGMVFCLSIKCNQVAAKLE